MRFISWVCLVCLMSLLSIHTVAGLEQGQSITREMNLLAVSEQDGELVGNLADLSIEVIPGRGRVFIETFPLTRIDTQISTRLAKQIACDFVEEDCSRFDFIYTIRSGSPTIGGPSAGAATAALTVAALDDLPVDDKATVTGTISSGGLVGPVGGVFAKVKADINADMRMVLIPEGEGEVRNMSLDDVLPIG